jgi:hypothetical protein
VVIFCLEEFLAELNDCVWNGSTRAGTHSSRQHPDLFLWHYFLCITVIAYLPTTGKAVWMFLFVVAREPIHVITWWLRGIFTLLKAARSDLRELASQSIFSSGLLMATLLAPVVRLNTDVQSTICCWETESSILTSVILIMKGALVCKGNYSRLTWREEPLGGPRHRGKDVVTGSGLLSVASFFEKGNALVDFLRRGEFVRLPPAGRWCGPKHVVM